MDQKLSDFFRRKKTGTGAGVDWDERRDHYLAGVDDLYRQIEQILAEPVEQKIVVLQRRPKQLTENYIGTYSAQDLILAVGDEQVRFSPRGRNIVGAAGRVDVVGERGEAILILQPDSQWTFVESRQPTLRVVPLDESTLAEVLRLVMRA
ncbi:MAG TPA: hypothetical protein VIK18_27065 [Pirellulales bacterium]